MLRGGGWEGGGEGRVGWGVGREEEATGKLKEHTKFFVNNENRKSQFFSSDPLGHIQETSESARKDLSILRKLAEW